MIKQVPSFHIIVSNFCMCFLFTLRLFNLSFEIYMPVSKIVTCWGTLIRRVTVHVYKVKFVLENLEHAQQWQKLVEIFRTIKND